MKRFLLMMIAGFVLSACSLTSDDRSKKMAVPVPTPTKKSYEPVIVDMIQIEKSNANGIATIKQDGNKTKVIINLSGEKSASEPAHVHFGVCPKPGAIKYVLNDVVNGSSETELDVPIEELVASGSMAINVHKSIDDYATVVSCGDIIP